MRHFDSLLTELAMARSHYEDLRSSGAPFSDRLDARAHLNELRAQMGAVRRSTTS